MSVRTTAAERTQSTSDDAVQSPAISVGASLLAAVAVAIAVLGSLLLLGVALDRAEVQFDQLQQEKALGRAVRIRNDLLIATNLGIPLAEIRGMHDYAEDIPQQDPDIRFVAVTDANLNRLHYGGIGRRRLDPLLASPDLLAKTKGLLRGDILPGTSVKVGEFAITSLPIPDEEGNLLGFVHVAIQARQLRERFFFEIQRMGALALFAIILVIELTGHAYAAAVRDPISRLGELLRAAAGRGRNVALSGRHAGGDLGAAMFYYNAVLHRLARRTDRLLGYAAEVRGAVFEPAAIAEIDEAEKATRAEAADLAVGELARTVDARPSDIRPLVVVGTGVLALSVAWPLMLGDAMHAASGAIAGLAVFAICVLLRIPVVTALFVLALLIVGPTLEEAEEGMFWPCLAGACGGLLHLAFHYVRSHRLRLPPAWYALRAGSGIVLAALAVGVFMTLPAIPALAAVAVGVALLAVVARAPVRRLMFTKPSSQSSVMGHG